MHKIPAGPSAAIALSAAALLAGCATPMGSGPAIVSDAVGCKQRFDVTALRCAASASGDACLSEAQVKAVQGLHSVYRLPFRAVSAPGVH